MLEKKTASQCISYDYCRGWIDAVDAMTRWISVEERMPDKLKRVLVFKQTNGHALWDVAMWDIEIDWRGESDWSKNSDGGLFSVTHWMPLPEPPEA